MKEKLIDIFESPISGVWGDEPDNGVGFPVLRTTNFTNEGVINYNDVTIRKLDLKKPCAKFLKRGDIIIEKSGGSDKQPVGRVVYFDGQENTYLFNNFTAVLRVRDHHKWNSRYVFFSLFSIYKKGGTTPYQNRTTGLHNLQLSNFLSDFCLNAISLTEQNDCVNRIDKIDITIAKRKIQLEKLDLLVKAKFYEMFGSVKENLYKYEVSTVGKECRLKSGNSLPVEIENEGGEVPYVKVGDMTYKGCDKYLNTSSHMVSIKTAAKGLFPIGTTIFPKRGGAISTNKKRFTTIPICADLNVMGVTPKNRINPEYLYTYFVEVDLGLLNNGSSVPQINNKDIAPLEILVPPLDLQNKFAHFVERIENIKSKIKQSLEKLELLKQSLLQKYFG